MKHINIRTIIFILLVTVNVLGTIILCACGNSNNSEQQWNLILVNGKNSIPKNYEVTLTELSNGNMVDERIYPELQQMFDAARSEGIYPTVSEAYRTAEEQEEMMNEKIREFIEDGYSKRKAKKLAKNWVAKPGNSEHELGLALDINADMNFSEDEKVYGWLAENSYKYGFILRYPPGKDNITGIDYEPWHYRYVGQEAASEIFQRQICLEEYLSDT